MCILLQPCWARQQFEKRQGGENPIEAELLILTISFKNESLNKGPPQSKEEETIRSRNPDLQLLPNETHITKVVMNHIYIYIL